MAAFLANRILNGLSSYDRVPAALKEAVAEILRAHGRPELCAEEV